MSSNPDHAYPRIDYHPKANTWYCQPVYKIWWL